MGLVLVDMDTDTYWRMINLPEESGSGGRSGGVGHKSQLLRWIQSSVNARLVTRSGSVRDLVYSPICADKPFQMAQKRYT